MPPVHHLPSLISEATARRLAQQYAPSQTFEDPELSFTEAVSRGTPAPRLNPPPDGKVAPQGRGALPARDAVSDANIQDLYASFILFCNPDVPVQTDSTELKMTFRSPPKSDGKLFNTFTLFELIKKLEKKEIKTWAQLAIELGVEPPALEKGQSTQKVQQYTVRLKVSLCPRPDFHPFQK